MGISIILKDFVLENFDTTEDEFWLALVSSSTIVYQNHMVCMMSNEFIYYFGTIPVKRKTKEFYKFYKQFNLTGKNFVSKDTTGYKNHIKENTWVGQ